MFRSCLAIWLLLGCSQSLLAQEFQTPYTLDQGETVQSRSPEVHYANSKIYTAYYAGVLNIRFAKSLDQGQTFEKPSLVVEGVSTNQYNMMLQRAPKFAVAPDGTIHLTWTEDRTMGQGDVWYVRSTDDGTTWTSPVSLSGKDDSMRYAQDFVSIAVDSSSILHVSFLDMREGGRGLSKYTQMYYTRSSDNGMTWSEPVKVSLYESGDGGTCECCKQEIAAGKSGEVFIAYRSNIEDNRSIFALRSTDQGLSWSKAIRIQDEDWMIMACPTQGPDISVDPTNNLHLTWRDARNESTARDRIYYDVLSRNEGTGSLDKEVTTGSEMKGTWPAIALRQYGTQIIPEVYYQSMSLNGNIKRRILQDGVFSEPSAISKLAMDAELPAASANAKGDVFVAWQETGDLAQDQGDIFFARAISTASVENIPDSDVSRRKKVNQVRLPAGFYRVRVLDMLGRAILQQAIQVTGVNETLDARSLVPGVYLIEVASDQGSTLHYMLQR
jgi:hypothetical protein